MENQVVYTAKNIEITYNAQQGYLYTNWKGFQNVASIQSGCENMLEQLKRHSCKKVLNDNRLVTGPWSAANEWVVNDWFPRMYAAGLEHLALIVSPNLFSQLSMNQMVAALDSTEKTNTFGDFELAKAWLINAGKQ